jgi:D-psicose/D-tagatose/L-ribulose 3-epimerase
MRLAISNIAWDVEEDESIVDLLHRYGVDAIDIAPAKYFPDPANASDEDIVAVKTWWAARGIEVTGMQALLFGTSGLNLFSSSDVQQAMLDHLAAVCRIGAGLGAVRVVFGSPKNRDRSSLTDQETNAIAVPFLERLGEIASAHGVCICLEPNPPRYGANFMTTSQETAQIVKQVAHSAIRMQFDTGAVTINGESCVEILEQHSHLIGHVHASEPDLLPLGDWKLGARTDHAAVHEALARYLPGHLVTVEMVATKNEPHLISIERALKEAICYYRTGAAEASI